MHQYFIFNTQMPLLYPQDTLFGIKVAAMVKTKNTPGFFIYIQVELFTPPHSSETAHKDHTTT